VQSKIILGSEQMVEHHLLMDELIYGKRRVTNLNIIFFCNGDVVQQVAPYINNLSLVPTSTLVEFVCSSFFIRTTFENNPIYPPNAGGRGVGKPRTTKVLLVTNFWCSNCDLN
jgi:hypothetical protein